MEEQERFAASNPSRELEDPAWRRFDPVVDPMLDWESEADQEARAKFWDGGGSDENLYYWRKGYWLRAMRNPS